MSKFVPAAIVAMLLIVAASPSEARGRHHGGYYDGYHYDNYRHHGYRHRHKRRSDRGAYLVGGLILGSLITHAITENRHHRRESTIRTSSRRVASPGRHLYRDRFGDCFEKVRRGGDELMIELDPSQCAW